MEIVYRGNLDSQKNNTKRVKIEGGHMQAIPHEQSTSFHAIITVQSRSLLTCMRSHTHTMQLFRTYLGVSEGAPVDLGV